MTKYPTALERAFTLASSGEYTSISDIRAQLDREGLRSNQIEGPRLLKQLRELCVAGVAAKNRAAEG